MNQDKKFGANNFSDYNPQCIEIMGNTQKWIKSLLLPQNTKILSVNLHFLIEIFKQPIFCHYECMRYFFKEKKHFHYIISKIFEFGSLHIILVQE